MFDRRHFMQGTIASAVAGALASRAWSASKADAAGSTIEATRLADELFMFSGAGGNVVTFGDAGNGLLMVDTGAAEHTGALLDAVQSATGSRRIVTAFNTHWHWDHTGGNDLLAKEIQHWFSLFQLSIAGRGA